MNWILFILVIVVIILLFIAFKVRKSISLVKENSAKCIKLDKLNKTYKFNENVKRKIEIEYFVKTKTELSTINFDKLINDFLSDNTNNLFLNIKGAIENEKKYDEYLKKYNAIDDVTEVELVAVTNMKLKTFLYLENKVFKAEKEKPVVDTKLNVVAKFDTPKGENKYQKDKMYKFDELKKFYNELNH